MRENTNPYDIQQGIMTLRGFTDIKPSHIAIDTYETYQSNPKCWELGIDKLDGHSDYVITAEDLEQYMHVTTGLNGAAHYWEIIFPFAPVFDRLDTKYGVYIVSMYFDANETTHQIIFNDNQIYCFRRQLMDKVCIPCEDKKMFKKLELFMFFEIMFKDSVRANRIDEAMKYYKKMLQVVGLKSTVAGDPAYSTNPCSIENCPCTGGLCSCNHG